MLNIIAIYPAQARTWLQCNVDSVYVESVCRQIYQWLCWTFQSKFKRFFCFWQWHFAFIVNRYHLLYSLAYCCCCRCCSRCCCRWCSLDSVNCCSPCPRLYLHCMCVCVCFELFFIQAYFVFFCFLPHFVTVIRRILLHFMHLLLLLLFSLCELLFTLSLSLSFSRYRYLCAFEY